jgi:hypothetical protein
LGVAQDPESLYK